MKKLFYLVMLVSLLMGCSPSEREPKVEIIQWNNDGSKEMLRVWSSEFGHYNNIFWFVTEDGKYDYISGGIIQIRHLKVNRVEK